MPKVAKKIPKLDESKEVQSFLVKLAEIEQVLTKAKDGGPVDTGELKTLVAEIRESSSVFLQYLAEIQHLEARVDDVTRKAIREVGALRHETARVSKIANDVAKQTVKLWDSDTTRRAITISSVGSWSVLVILAITLATMAVKMAGAESVFLEAWKALLLSFEKLLRKGT